MKNPDWKKALFLSTALFALGSFAYWLQFSHKPKKERTNAELKKPLPFAAESTQIAAFKIKSAQGLIEGKCLSLAKKTCKVGSTAEWSITYPTALAGDGDVIRDFLNNASGMSATETVDLKEESPEQRAKLMEAYGLSDSRRTQMGSEFIELILEDGKHVTAWFGEAHPIGDKSFVGTSIDGKLNTETVFLIANFHRKNLFEKGLTHFRDKSIFNFERTEVDQFQAKFIGRSQDATLKANLKDGTWTLNGYPADYDRVETLISAIAQVRAKEFPLEQDLKGARTQLSYELHLKNGTTLPFEILTRSNPKDKTAPPIHYLRSKSLKIPYEVESAFVVQVDKKLKDLKRNLLLTPAEEKQITTLKLSGKAFDPAVEFHLDGKMWVQKSQGTNWDATKISGLMHELSTSHASEIVTPAPAAPAGAFSLTLGEDQNPARFQYRIFEVGGKAYAADLQSKSREAFLLDAGLKNALPFKSDSWKTK